MMMTSSDTQVRSTDARREAQGARIVADKCKRPCPSCGSDRLFPQAGISNKNKLICYNCGGRFRKKGS